MKASSSGVYWVLHFTVAFLKDKATDSFLKKKNTSQFYLSFVYKYTHIYTYAHIHKHVKEVFNLQTEFKGDAGLLVITSHFDFPKP